MTTTAQATTRRPDRRLLLVALVHSLRWGPLFPLPLIRDLVRWRTLEYRFDDEGLHASWGVLFRREITLAYSRIQDLHLLSSVVERWLGLARIEIQTAAGSSGAEMVIEGLPDYEEVRDELARRMKGPKHGGSALPAHAEADPLLAVAAQLQQVATELATIRRLLAPPPPATRHEDRTP